MVDDSNSKPLKVLWGARAIGAHIGLPTRKAFYLLEKGLLPGEKIGKIWTSTEDRLADRIRGDASVRIPAEGGRLNEAGFFAEAGFVRF